MEQCLLSHDLTFYYLLSLQSGFLALLTMFLFREFAKIDIITSYFFAIIFFLYDLVLRWFPICG